MSGAGQSRSSAEQPRVVDVDGVPIAYRALGSGRPLLAVHGWSADHRYLVADLEPVFAARQGWSRIHLDLPGHGATPAPSWLTSNDQMLALLQGFVDAVLPGQRFAVLGNSYGGYLSLGLVRTMADRIEGAALVVPDVPAADGTRELERPVTFYPDPDLFDDLADDEAWIPEALPHHEARALHLIRAHDMPAYRSCDRELLARLEAEYVLTGAAGRPGRPFPMPSLVIGGRQDATVGFRAASRLVDELPRATFAVLDLAGHHLGRIERPAVFEALVVDWLDRLELHRARGEAPGPAADAGRAY